MTPSPSGEESRVTKIELERWAYSPEPEDGQELLSATVLKASSFARHALRLWDERDQWEKYGREATKLLNDWSSGWRTGHASEGSILGLTRTFLSQPPPLTSTPSPETKEER